MGLSRSKVKWVFWQQFGLLDVHPVLKHVILSVQECTVLISISRTKLARFSSSSRSMISWIQELQTIIKPSRSLHTPPGSGVGHISYSTRLSQQPLEKEKKHQSFHGLLALLPQIPCLSYARTAEGSKGLLYLKETVDTRTEGKHTS